MYVRARRALRGYYRSIQFNTMILKKSAALIVCTVLVSSLCMLLLQRRRQASTRTRSLLSPTFSSDVTYTGRPVMQLDHSAKRNQSSATAPSQLQCTPTPYASNIKVLGRGLEKCLPSVSESVTAALTPDDVYITIKTTQTNHDTRLSPLLLTWLQTVQPEQVHVPYKCVTRILVQWRVSHGCLTHDSQPEESQQVLSVSLNTNDYICGSFSNHMHTLYFHTSSLWGGAIPTSYSPDLWNFWSCKPRPQFIHCILLQVQIVTDQLSTDEDLYRISSEIGRHINHAYYNDSLSF